MLYTKEELEMRSYSELRRMASMLSIELAAFINKKELIDEIIRKTNENIRTNGAETASKETTSDGKGIFTREYPDGRKDVEVTVKTIDVEVNDEPTRIAKETIEGTVFDKLSKQQVLVTVINKDTGDFASMQVAVNNVRNYAQAVVDNYKIKHPIISMTDFIIHEYHIDNGTVNVSRL